MRWSLVPRQAMCDRAPEQRDRQPPWLASRPATTWNTGVAPGRFMTKRLLPGVCCAPCRYSALESTRTNCLSGGLGHASWIRVTPREEFHRFVDDMQGELADMAKTPFHAVIDDLEAEWVLPGLSRMRSLRRDLGEPSSRLNCQSMPSKE
jgi:hypothetical protein